MKKLLPSRLTPGTMRLNEEFSNKPFLAIDPGSDSVVVLDDIGPTDPQFRKQPERPKLPMFDIDKLLFKRRRDNLQITEAFIGEKHVATIYGLKKRKAVSQLPVLRFGNFVIEFHNVPIPEVEGSDFWSSHYAGAKDMVRTTLSVIPE